ncbi:MAG: hypothetical protein ACXAEX_07345 [Promethearchaeota archaeon]|jgi:hypothetical protein
MVELNIFQSGWNLLWEDPIGWFLELPLLSQILIIIGIIAIAIAAIVLVYYILKGVAYLIYYIFKGLYYLLKGIFISIYKLFEALWYAISGRPKKKAVKIPPPHEPQEITLENVPVLIKRNELRIANYCTECGQKITDSMNSLLISRGTAYCFYCGNEFKLKKVQNSQF